MNSKEEFDIGLDGIDTSYERDYINYHPKITYDPQRMASGGDGTSVDTTGQEALGEVGESSVISVWEDVVDVIKGIDELEESLSEKLKDVSVPLPLFVKDKIKEAAEKMGYRGEISSIPFDLYKMTFQSPDDPGARLIQDVFEDYMSDVDGILNGELYADVAELQNDWKDMREFIDKGLFGQLVSQDKVPREASVDDAALQEIKEKEKEMVDEYAQLLKLQNINRTIYMELSQSEYGSDRYYQAVKEYDQTKRDVLDLEKALFTRSEIVDLVGRKASDATETIELIGDSIDYDPYEDDRYDLLYGLIKQFGSKESAMTGLKKMQAVLKLSVDKKKDKKSALQSNLRGIAGQPMKKKMNQTLINGIHLRNGVFREVYDIVNNMDGVPSNENFEVMMNHIAEGIEESELTYQGQASDFYKIHTMDANLRTEKLASIIDKDAARNAYKLLGGVVSYSKNVNMSWPKEEDLSGWLNDFMEHNKLT